MEAYLWLPPVALLFWGSAADLVGGWRPRVRAHAVPCLRFWLVKDRKRSTGYGVRATSIWKRLLGLKGVVIESVVIEDTDDGDLLVVAVRPYLRTPPRCGECGRRAPWYDRGGRGPPRWRPLGFGAGRG